VEESSVTDYGIGWRFNMPRFDGHARCTEADPDAWFPEPGGSPHKAKRVCNGCEVRDQCLAWALAHDEAGVWGGTTENERRRIAGRRVRVRQQPINHGTEGGYKQHHRRGEKPCLPCWQANSLKGAARRRQDGAA
jgi:WhiB family redox-sensing transcriptional regulator